MNKKKLNQLKANLLLSVIAIIIFLIFFEMILKLYYNKKYNYDNFENLDKNPKKVVFKMSTPHYVEGHYIYNTLLSSQGLRDREFNLTKANNTIRIAILGDSFTFGNGIENTNATYPKVLEETLIKTGNKNIEVINFGMSGLNILDIYWILKYKVLKYRPDIVLYGFYENDVDFYLYNIDLDYCRLLEQDSNKFAIKTFLESRLNNIMTKMIPLNQNYEKYIYLRHPAWHCFENILTKIKLLSEKDNFTFIVFFIPYHTGPNPLGNKMENYMYKKVKSSNLEVIPNFFDAFVGKKGNLTDAQLRADPKTDRHYNEIGHKIIAGIIYDYLIESELLNVGKENETQND